MNGKNILILKKIIHYADQITLTIENLTLDFEKLEADFIAKNALSMCILQIGELAGRLTEDFKIKYPEMPWQNIKAMRNIAAHNYGEFDDLVLWETVTNDIPELKAYCEKIIKLQS